MGPRGAPKDCSTPHCSQLFYLQWQESAEPCLKWEKESPILTVKLRRTQHTCASSRIPSVIPQSFHSHSTSNVDAAY